MNGISTEYASARRANEMRYAQAMSIYDEIIKRYQPGGTFGQAALGQLEKQKVRDVGAETQQMISSGLYGTTTTAGLPGKWEAEVGAPARLRLEDIMMERLSQAQIGKAGFIERREDVYPAVGAAAGYAQQEAAARPTSTWGQYKPLSQFMSEFDVRNRGGVSGSMPVPTTTPTTPTTTMPSTYGQAQAETPTQQQVGMTGGMGTLPGMKTEMTSKEAFGKLDYTGWKAWAEGKGMKVGSQAEWAAVKRRIG